MKRMHYYSMESKNKQVNLYHIQKQTYVENKIGALTGEQSEA